MTKDLDHEVERRQWDHDFDELAGRATPPDRLAAILQRVANSPPAISTPRRPAMSGRGLLTAAAILLGLSVTMGVAMLRQDDAGRTADEAAANWSFAIPRALPLAVEQQAFEQQAFEQRASQPAERSSSQDPPPRPVQDPKPKPVQDPKPTPKVKPAPDPEKVDPEKANAEKANAEKANAEKANAEKTNAEKANAEKAKAKDEKAKTDPAGQAPKGNDPADLAAIRSAEAMLEAERKLKKSIAEGKITGFDKFLDFDELSGWKYEEGLTGMPERIKALSGKKVLMTGFMLPLDEVQHIKEFLLVQSLWSCCYGQPPDVHGLVRCVMPKGKTSDYSFDPLKVIGTFTVGTTMIDGYCVDIYQLHVESLERIE